MGRIRNIKPQFFKDAELYDAETESGLPLRVAYAGLWTIADRKGRFRWKPREIKTDILPYDNLDMSAVMDALVKYGFIFKYKVAGFDYGFIPNFEKHQFINRNEAQSTLPEPPENSNAQSLTNSALAGDEKPPEIHHEYTASSDFLTQTQTQTFQTLEPRAPKRARSPKGTRWPSEAVVPEEWLRDAEAARAEHNLPEIDLRLEAKTFANYWASRSRDACKLDWHRTWINRVLDVNAHRQSNGNRRESAHDKGTRAAARLIAEFEAGNADRDHHGTGSPVVALSSARYDRGQVASAFPDVLRGPEGQDTTANPDGLPALASGCR